FFSIRRQDDVIGLAQSIRTGELFAEDGHRVRVDCREGRTFLSIAAFTFVGDIRDLFIRRETDAIRPAPGWCDAENSSPFEVKFHELVRRTKRDVSRLSVLRNRNPDWSRSNGKRGHFLHGLRIDLGNPAIHLPAAGIAVNTGTD